MIAELDAWIEKLRNKTPLEETELELLCRIVKDILMQEPNVIVFLIFLSYLFSLSLPQLLFVATFTVSTMI